MLRAPDDPVIYTERDAYQPQSTTGEVLEAAFQMGYRQTTVQSLARSKAIESQMEEGPLLDPEIINEKYKINTKTPLTERAAIVIQGEQEEVNRINTIIANGPKSFWGGTVPGFLGAVAGGMSDPVDMLGGVLIGGVARGLAIGVKALRTMPTSKAVVEGLKWAKYGPGSEIALSARTSFMADAIGNIISNGATEAFNYNASKKEQMELAAGEVFRNVVATSIMFTGVIHGGSAVIRKISQKIGDNAIQQLHNTAELAVQTGQRVDKILERPLAILEKDLEIDAPMRDAISTVFPEQSSAWLKEGMDVADVRKAMLSDPTITPERMAQFIDELDSNGWEMRKMYLFEDNPNPRFSPEDIARMEEDLHNPKNAEWYNEEAAEISRALDNQEFDAEIDFGKFDEPLRTVEDINQALLKDESIQKLAKYDVDVAELEKSTGLKFKEFRQMDEIAVKQKKNFETYQRSLKDYVACVLGTLG